MREYGSLFELTDGESVRQRIARFPSIFGCCPSGVELLATGGYVRTVSGDLPHSTQDIPVYGIISGHSADLKFCFYTLSIVDLAVF